MAIDESSPSDVPTPGLEFQSTEFDLGSVESLAGTALGRILVDLFQSDEDFASRTSIGPIFSSHSSFSSFSSHSSWTS
jgi:hypothetical protein